MPDRKPYRYRLERPARKLRLVLGKRAVNRESRLASLWAMLESELWRRIAVSAVRW